MGAPAEHPAVGLVRRYDKAINALLYNYNIPRCAWDDVKQEVRIRLFHLVEAGKFVPTSPRTSFNYVYQAAKWEARNQLSKDRRTPTDDLERAHARPCSEPRPDEVVELAFRRAMLKDAMEDMPTNYRAVLDHYLAGLPVADYAAKHGIAFTTARVHLFRARRYLRAKLSTT